jgi:ribosomal protein L13E
MWTRRDWDDFFQIVRSRWQRFRPPRPVDVSVKNRVRPAAGFSLAELNAAGVSLEQAETFGLPVDVGRVGTYGANVFALRDFVRMARVRH